MKLIAWDTSTKTGAIAAVEWNENDKVKKPKTVSEFLVSVENTFHSERLLWAIHQVLKSANWKLEEIDLFGVGQGPGSFTGLRIGMTTARTLADALDKPLIGFSSLSFLARPACDMISILAKKEAVFLVVAMDACKGELYSLLGRTTALKDGIHSRGVEELVLSPEELCKKIEAKLKSDSKLKWAILGNGRERYSEVFDRLPKKKEFDLGKGFADWISPRTAAYLCFEAEQKGLSREALSVFPRYLRDSEAEVKLRRGLLKPQNYRVSGSA